MFMETQETIIHRLVMRNQSFDAYVSFLIFMVWGLKTRPESWPTEWTFWANRYLEIMFLNQQALTGTPL